MAVTVSVPAVAASNSAVAVPFTTSTVRVWSPYSNRTWPSASAGVMAAVAWMVPPAVTWIGSSVRSVVVASDSTVTVPWPVLLS